MSKLFIVVPCYNEEEVLPISSKVLLDFLKRMIAKNKVSTESSILFVDDGSKDKTWAIIKRLSEQEEHFKGLKFSRNFGHQNALLAGMTTAVQFADMIVTIDADLQDDVEAIEGMIDAYHDGNDVVYGVRSNRDTDTAFKRKTAEMFYSFMNKLGVNTVQNHADFRLMSNRATKVLLTFKEENLFLRGMVPLVGFPSTKVYYSRNIRVAGESKYPLKKMLNFAMEGITSFSIVPIKMVRNIGFITLLIGIFYMIYSLIQHFTGNVEAGWSSLIISIWFLGGIQLISLSIVGEYIGKIYSEVKGRPRFIIEEEV
ncbi:MULTISPECIES: glycosyltransferase family 2 protein [Enterococcus]|uniref:glycosyltransferase family 2 protein n=1 Tax=Enterococcus TaxID=1350 RepID=UPI000990EE70|nr:glycosyltransferase family 2 protein [Enterococcus faecalis]MBB6643096.1 glycosyltransferase family 2 protein [Enterococcus faecalis]MCV3126075.1 glycosyltransferase family 2 protein [Enterococcus faecalis]MCV3134787.1 glycosyltransferase family 2 protein [Enterococcus faecalis]MCV5995978.1 glycosyltransferase family 2 protein [Enterococcus faecalis]MDK4366813.1 glycosyltransferase family 2 protein [Enterococcus faecalis]